MTHSPLLQHYDRYIAGGQIQDDPAQREVLARLQALNHRLGKRAQQPSGLLKFFAKQPATEKLKGIYVWGSVGRGKSMLMDLFFENSPVQKKRRVHFHAFMQEVHARIHQLRKDMQSRKGIGDPVVLLAQEIAAETSLLCFDELQATDVADATLLYRLFERLFESGVTIVSTSNRPPASLYTGGVQAERFGKFIALIEESMEVIALDSPRDYRHMQGAALRKTYHWPLGESAERFLRDTLADMGIHNAPSRASLLVGGRKLEFQVYGETIGAFHFRDLCEMPLGAADYLAIAQKLDVMILKNIPKLPAERRNEAKRFVTLIDALYEHKVKLICTAEVPPEGIYAGGDGSFEFKRTVSRLTEMQSGKWTGND